VKEELQQIFDSVPEDEPRSPLEPYRELILRWRRQGRTYRRICQMLGEKCNVKVAYGPLYRFVQRRSRPRKVQPEPESEPAGVQPVPVDQRATLGKRLSTEERAAQIALIRSLNTKPVVEEPPKPGWNFDTDKPRTIQKP
jgi:hypothetical protein